REEVLESEEVKEREEAVAIEVGAAGGHAHVVEVGLDRAAEADLERLADERVSSLRCEREGGNQEAGFGWIERSIIDGDDRVARKQFDFVGLVEARAVDDVHH